MKRLAGITVILAIAGSASATLIIDEDFAYSDGALTTVASGTWSSHSGTTGADISSEELLISGANSLDVNRTLGSTYNSGMLYYGLNIKLTAQPSATTYFAHFLQTSSTFRDRLFSQASGSGYVLGISNSSSSPTLWATELSLNTTYRVIVEANLDSDTTTMWIDPVDILSPSVSLSVASTVNPTAMAFRQATGIGSIVIDELQVGTTFDDVNVIPEPATVGLLAGPGLGILVACMRRRREDEAGA